MVPRSPALLKATRFLQWLAPFFLLLLAGSCEWRRREAFVAHVDDAAIAPVDVSAELRAMLWRRGEAWGALDEATHTLRRKEALDRCVNARLMAQFAKSPEKLSPAQAKASEDEFQQFLKQFEPPDGWAARLQMQGVGEVPMRERITAEVTQGSAIEAWLKEQRRASATGTAEKAAHAWFDQHREELRIPERARVSHLFLTSHDETKPDRGAEITDFHRQLTAGESTLDALATKVSEDARSNKNNGSLGWVSRDRMPADFAEQIFTLPLKKLSAPFQTRLGWHIVIVHDRQASRLPEFSEVKPEVMARLDQLWREEAVKRLVESLRAKAKIEVNEWELGLVEPAP